MLFSGQVGESAGQANARIEANLQGWWQAPVKAWTKPELDFLVQWFKLWLELWMNALRQTRAHFMEVYKSSITKQAWQELFRPAVVQPESYAPRPQEAKRPAKRPRGAGYPKPEWDAFEPSCELMNNWLHRPSQAPLAKGSQPKLTEGEKGLTPESKWAKWGPDLAGFLMCARLADL